MTATRSRAIAIIAGAVLTSTTRFSATAETIAVQRDFDVRLDIAQRRIAAAPFEADAAVGFDRPLRLRVGGAVSSPRAEIVLREVRGNARFHGDLTPITRVLATHHIGADGAKETP